MNIPKSSTIDAKNLTVGKDVYIGPNVTIKSSTVTLSDYTRIDSNMSVHTPDEFSVGACSWFANDVRIKARSFKIGEYAVVFDGVEVGRGGSTGPDSHVTIGNYVMLCEKTMLNPSERITIGDDVGIGAECEIWTHGSYLDIMAGFPANFAPVTIGSHVWLPSRTIVLPGVSVGSNVVIGINTLVNKNIPDGCLAGGIPVKILRENVYPKQLTPQEKEQLVNPIIEYWLNELCPHKGIRQAVRSVSYHSLSDIITLDLFDTQSIFYIGENRKIESMSRCDSLPELDSITEDLRDFLRRRGIKIFTGLPFKSINPPVFHG